MRRRLPLTLALLAACGGERPDRGDAGDALDVPARDAVLIDVPLIDGGVCGDAGARDIPTALTPSGRCTPRSAGRWCEGDVVRTCGTVAGEAVPLRAPCAPGERCVMRGARGACEPVGSCRDGATRCAGPNRLARCAMGAWAEEPCAARCVGDGLGAACVDPGVTRSLTGTLRYERRAVAANLLGWQAPAPRPARGFAAHYLRGDAVLARGVTDAQGRYTLDAPATRIDGDRVVFTAAVGDEGWTVLMVGDPGLTAGTYGTFTSAVTQGAPWRWSFPAPDDGATLTIAAADAPGASVFDDLRSGYAAVRARMPGAPRYALAAWVKRAVLWDCGACFSELTPVTAAGQRFDGQIWLTGDASENWWSDAVTLHELGHWVMGAWGTIPHEGGAHFLGVPIFPGFAWSEGFASWASSELRGDPRHYAVAQGTFFWWDLARREIFNGARWIRPNPMASLLQPIDENEVAAILWSLREDPTAGAERIYRAIPSPRLNAAPFARCNTQTYYASDGGTCTSGEPAPHLADLLDALRCDGVPAAVVGAAAGTYPYPAASPRCEAGCAATACTPQRACGAAAPFVLDVREAAPGRVVVRVAQPGDLGVPTRVRVSLPPDVFRTDGALLWELPAHTDGAEVLTLRGAGDALVEVVAEADAGWAGARAQRTIRVALGGVTPGPMGPAGP